jgi:hypothetical protein
MDIVPMAICSSWDSFERTVKGTKDYLVTHGKKADTGDYEYEFHCTCPAFQFRKGECKHIKSVRDEACLWHEQFDAPVQNPGVCPKCGASTVGIMCAV